MEALLTSAARVARAVRYQTCSSCEHQQELPAIFCGSCGAPLIRISKILLMTLLTLTVAAYVWFGLFNESLLWPWPLYIYYALLFVLFSYAVTRRHPIITLRMLAWSSILLYAMWFFWISGAEGLRLLTSDIRDFIDYIEGDVLSQWIVLGAVVLLIILAFVILGRRFGYVYGYRVLLTFVALAALAAKFGFSYSVGETGLPVSPRLSEWFSWAPEKEAKELFELIGVNALRAIFAEMAVTSFIKAYKPAEDHFRQVAARTGFTPSGKAAATNPIADAAARLTAAVLRTGILLQHFFIIFARTIGHYLWAVYRSLRRVFLDLVLPVAALVVAAFLIAVLTEHTAAYVAGGGSRKLVWLGPIRSTILMMPVVLVLIFLAQIVFLGAITKFSFRALMRCNALLVLWIAPFFFAFFVFVSFSLILTGTVMRRWDHESFPYRVGPLTLGATAILVVLIAFAMLHTRRRGRAAPADEIPLDIEQAPQPDDANGAESAQPR